MSAASGGGSQTARRAPLSSRNDIRRNPPKLAAAAAAYAASPGPHRRALSARPSSGAGSKRPAGGMDALAPYGYQTISPIAQGAFSQVARARHLNSGREVAVKTFNKAKIGKEAHLVQAMKNELDVLQKLKATAHPNVANIIELLDTKTSFHAILEYCSGGSLQRKLAGRPHATGLPTPHVVSNAGQVAGALAHMHGMGIAHRDIKPENVLFTDTSQEVIKICDFGFAVACGTRRVRTVCGSPQYMAPELSRREPYHAWAVDMWAFGALTFEMLEGKPAFRGSSMEQLNIRIMRASHEAFTGSTPPQARAVIKSLLVVDAENRLQASKALELEFFSGHRAASGPTPPAVPPVVQPTATEALAQGDQHAE